MLAGNAVRVAGGDGAEPGSAPAALFPADRDIRARLPALCACRTATELTAWLRHFARSLGFYGARYVHVGNRWWALEQTALPLRLLTTSSRADDEDAGWLVRDPCAGRVQRAFAPFAWTTRPDAALSDLQRRWLEGERARGISAGVAVPVQDSAEGPAYLSLYGYDEAAVSDLVGQHAPDLAFVAAQFHALAKPLVKRTGWTPSLSRREVEVLRLAALGKTYDESAAVLGVSHRTVEYHLRRASEKLGAATKIRAVVLAFGMGLAGG